MRFRFVPLLTLFLLAATGRAETRFFVSTAGTLLEAELIAVNGPIVALRKKDDASMLNVPRSTLCREDQGYIDFWAAAHPEMAAQAPAAPAPAAPVTGGPKFSLTSSIRSAKSSRGAADGGYRTIDIAYNITLQSREVKRDLTGAKAVMITLGKEAASGSDDRLYVMQKLEWEVNLRAQGKFEQTTPEVRLSYYQGTNYRDGAREYGYIFIVLDAAGVIQHVDCTPDGNEKHAQAALAFTAPSVIDRDFRTLANANFHNDIVVNR
jgi:hypothetical protein